MSEATMFIRHKKNSILLWLMAGILILFAGCDSLPWQEEAAEPTPVPIVTGRGLLTVEGQLVPQQWSALSFPSGGKLDELLVAEGDVVAAGDLLARLGQREPLAAAVSQAELALLSAQQELDTLLETAPLSREQASQALVAARMALTDAQYNRDLVDTDEFQAELDDLNIAVQDARDVLDDAEEELERYQDLDPDNPTRDAAQTAYDDALRAYEDAVYERDVRQYDREQAEAAVELAVANRDEAQRIFDNWQDGPDAGALALAEAQVAAATAQVAAAQQALDDTSLTAPYGGTIVDLHNFQPGELVPPGQPLITLADDAAWIVETRDLTELDVVLVKPGQEVEVTPDALPDLVLAGTVDSIARTYYERSGDVLYTVRIRLDEDDARLRWGMTVSVVFEP
jgi:multidrug efflux pump subunit AcrA (membrane-fusion protein)